jgi:hypothetical protein
MSEITFSDARSRAMAAVTRMAEEQRLGDIMILDEYVVETDLAWYFPNDSVASVLRGDISSALAGNLPVRVSRDGTQITYEEPKNR